MLTVRFNYYYAKRQHAECRYPECRGALVAHWCRKKL
jgi:hypothetical protein